MDSIGNDQPRLTASIVSFAIAPQLCTVRIDTLGGIYPFDSAYPTLWLPLLDQRYKVGLNSELLTSACELALLRHRVVVSREPHHGECFFSALG